MITLTLEEDGKVLKRIDAHSVLFAAVIPGETETAVRSCGGGMVGQVSAEDVAYLLNTTQHTATDSAMALLTRDIRETYPDMPDFVVEQLAARTAIQLFQQVAKADMQKAVVEAVEEDR